MSAETGPGATWQNNPLAALVRNLSSREARAALAWAETQDAEVDKICDRIGAEIKDELQREAAARAEGREEGLVQGFADCEALVVAMLTAMAHDVVEREVSARQDLALSSAREFAEIAKALTGAALAVSLGQHRTDAKK